MAATQSITFYLALPNATYDSTAGRETLSLDHAIANGNHRQWWFNRDDLGSIMMVRECYRTLWNLIDNGWHSAIRNDFLVLGTPGIGQEHMRACKCAN